MLGIKQIYLLILLIVLNSCENLMVVPGVEPFVTGSVETVSINKFTLEVTGNIKRIGDGIVQHGHVWSDNINILPTVLLSTKTVFGPTQLIGPYLDQLNSNLFEAGLQYSVRSYAEDIHGTVVYGDPIIFIKSFSFENRFDVAGAALMNLESSVYMPIISLSDGSFIVGVNEFPQTPPLPQRIRSYLIGFLADGSKDPNFSLR